jgi:hypothetical protein
MNAFFWIGFAAGISAGGLALALLILFICIACNRDASKCHDGDQGELP